jgi:MFS family permease
MSTVLPAAPLPLPVGRLVSVGAIIFAANAAMLVLQLVAGRLLAPFIGSSLETWTAIIGVFLTGIALGNGFGGRIADRYPTPRALAVLLVCGALAALWMFAFPQILSATGLHTALPLGPRIPVLAFLLCLPAGLVLSLLTPLAIKLGLPDVAHTGRVAGLIFALSTLGCLLGNYVTGFVLIPMFTVNALVFVSAGVLVVLAFAALVLPKPSGVAADAPHGDRVQSVEGSDVPSAVAPKGQTVEIGSTTMEVAVSRHDEYYALRLGGVIRTTVLLFLIGVLASAYTLSMWPSVIIVLGSAVWASVDAANLELHKYKGKLGAGGTFIGVLLLWVVCFPIHLWNRSRCRAGLLERDEVPLPTGGVGAENADGGTNPHAFSDIRIAYLVVFLASFCGMALELTASRVLAQQLGVSLFTWTGIIGVMLAGTALGNFTGGQLADRIPHGTAGPKAVTAFVVSVLVGGALGLFAVHDRELPAVESALGIPARNWVKYSRLNDFEYLDRREEAKELSESVLPPLMWRVRAGLFAGLAGGALVGLSLASAILRRARRNPSAADPRMALAATLCLAGGASVFMFVALALLTNFSLFAEWGPITEVLGWTFSLFFLPMFALGFVSPQVIRLAVPNVANVGTVAGRVYAWSTGGAIAGTFAAGYALMSALGTYNTVLVLSLVLVCTSLLVAKVWERDLLLYTFAIVLGGIVGGFILSSTQRGRDVVALVESNYYTIRVGRMADDGRGNVLTLNLDRLLHSVVDTRDPKFLYYKHEEVQVELLRRARAGAAPGSTVPTRTLVIGGGGYTFPRYVVHKMPDADVDVVEIDPAVTRVAYDWLGLERNERLKPYHMDGRQFVAERAAPGSYDLVVQDAVNDFSVPSHLMTKEYNDAVKRALKPNGAYLLTIIDAVAYGKLWRSAMATLRETFPAENVVLVVAETVPDAGAAGAKDWADTRRVMVIYASDKPLDLNAARAALLAQVPAEEKPRTAFGFLALAESVGVVLPPVRREPAFFSHVVPAANLKPYLDADPGVILTDQFCPTDNMMAEVFRQRKK